MSDAIYIRGAPAAALLGVCSATVLLWGRRGKLGEVRRDPDGAFTYNLAAIEELRGSKVSPDQLAAALKERQQVAGRVRRKSKRRYSAAHVENAVAAAIADVIRALPKAVAEGVISGLANSTLTIDSVTARNKRLEEERRLKEWNESPGRKALAKTLREIAPTS